MLLATCRYAAHHWLEMNKYHNSFPWTMRRLQPPTLCSFCKGARTPAAALAAAQASCPTWHRLMLQLPLWSHSAAVEP